MNMRIGMMPITAIPMTGLSASRIRTRTGTARCATGTRITRTCITAIRTADGGDGWPDAQLGTYRQERARFRRRLRVTAYALIGRLSAGIVRHVRETVLRKLIPQESAMDFLIRRTRA